MFRIIRNISLVLLFIFSSGNAVFSQTIEKDDNFFSPSNRLRFGDALFYEGDYLRAADEFAAFLNYESNDTVLFKIGYANLKLGNYFKAENVFQSLSLTHDLSLQAKLMLVKTKYLSGDESFVYSGNYDMLKIPEDKKRDIAKLKNLTLLTVDETVPDSADFFLPFESLARKDVLQFYDRKKNMKEKSPTLAATLSAIIPGSGKIYTENYGDGVTAFLVTGLLAFLAYDNFDAGHNDRAWIFTGLAAFFYAGNVYGSYLSAKTFNFDMRVSFNGDVKLFIKRNNYFINEPGFLKK